MEEKFITPKVPNTKLDDYVKPTYEELESNYKRAIKDLLQARALIEELSNNRGIQRLEFLFKVLDKKIEFNSEVVEKAVKEISEALYPTEDPKMKLEENKDE